MSGSLVPSLEAYFTDEQLEVWAPKNIGYEK